MPTNESIYVFGNSLFNFAEGGSQTNLAVWMNAFAQADGGTFEVSGGYGFLRNFADAPQPVNGWSFPGVTPAIDAGQSFGAADLDAVLITPANFIQYQSPGSNYYDDVRSPLDATNDVIRDVQATQPGSPIYIYEGWADMGPYSGDGIASGAELARYHAYNQGEYHDWYTTYVDELRADNPGVDVRLIPVASVLSDILTSTPLSELAPEDLYVDSAPHGTDTLYFLASMVTYTALTGTQPPADYIAPGIIHPVVAANFDQITDAIAVSLTQNGDFVIDPDEATVDPIPVDPDPVDPVPVDPVPVDPVPVDPEPVDPVPVDPAPVDPEPVDPLPVDPAPVDPEPVDPGPVDPVSVDPAPVDPEPVDPGPVDPTPVDPAPVDPAPTDPETVPDAGPLPDDGAEILHLERAFTVSQDGIYEFSLATDSQASLSIDSVNVLNNAGGIGSAPGSALVELAAGTYTAQIDYVDDISGRVVLDIASQTGAHADPNDIGLPAVDFIDDYYKLIEDESDDCTESYI